MRAVIAACSHSLHIQVNLTSGFEVQQSPLPQEFVGSVGIGDPKTCWLVDSGATCHIVSEKWVKHYTVSFEYPGPSPSLKGAGDNDLPVKGVVDLEFKVDKTHQHCIIYMAETKGRTSKSPGHTEGE